MSNSTMTYTTSGQNYLFCPILTVRTRSIANKGMYFNVSLIEGSGGSMSQVFGVPNNLCKHITNTAWVRARVCKLQKGCTRFAAASDKVYPLLVHGRWFSPCILASSTTKTGRHDIAEILLKVSFSTIKSINQSNH